MIVPGTNHLMQIVDLTVRGPVLTNTNVRSRHKRYGILHPLGECAGQSELTDIQSPIFDGGFGAVQDPEHPISELLFHNPQSRGWQSSRYCAT